MLTDDAKGGYAKRYHRGAQTAQLLRRLSKRMLAMRVPHLDKVERTIWGRLPDLDVAASSEVDVKHFDDLWNDAPGF